MHIHLMTDHDLTQSKHHHTWQHGTVSDLAISDINGVGRKMVQYVNCLQRPNWQPEHAIIIILNTAMDLTHKNQGFHYDSGASANLWSWFWWFWWLRVQKWVNEPSLDVDVVSVSHFEADWNRINIQCGLIGSFSYSQSPKSPKSASEVCWSEGG